MIARGLFIAMRAFGIIGTTAFLPRDAVCGVFGIVYRFEIDHLFCWVFDMTHI